MIAAITRQVASRSAPLIRSQQRRGIIGWMTNYPDKVRFGPCGCWLFRTVDTALAVRKLFLRSCCRCGFVSTHRYFSKYSERRKDSNTKCEVLHPLQPSNRLIHSQYDYLPWTLKNTRSWKSKRYKWKVEHAWVTPTPPGWNNLGIPHPWSSVRW